MKPTDQTGYIFAVETLPGAFQDEIRKYDLGKDGFWLTLAADLSTAQDQVSKMIKIVTGEKINPETLVGKVAPKRPKTKVQKWNGKVGDRINK